MVTTLAACTCPPHRFEVTFTRSLDPRFYSFDALTFYDKDGRSALGAQSGIVVDNDHGETHRPIGTWTLVADSVEDKACPTHNSRGGVR